jgi:orotidine-5'-phosphate decarboxylase
MNFKQKLTKIIHKNNSLLCVGLDSDLGKIPEKYLENENPQFEFNKWIIEQTDEFVCAYKPNMAFYEALGSRGFKSLELTMEYLHKNYPEIVTIADAKRGDISSTNLGYVKAIFDRLGFDCVTLHPYLGKEALQPFLDRKEKGCIVLCKTSNVGSGEVQNLEILQNDQISNPKSQSTSNDQNNNYQYLWEYVAVKVSKEWNDNKNCMLVVGATYPEELKKIREIVGEMTLLVPGVGVQGGDIGKTMQAGLNKKSMGLVINSSRGIIFSENPREAAKQLRNNINKYRK